MESYCKYTNVHEDVGGMKRLDFVIRTVKKFADGKEIKILDFGCGTGPVAIPIASLGYNIIGMDTSRKSIDIAKNRNKFKNLNFYCADTTKIRGMFDIIISTQVLEHTINPLLIIRHLSEHLNKDGIMIITIPNGYGMTETLGKIKKFFKIKRKNKKRAMNLGKFTADQGGHIQFFSIRSFREMAGKVSLKITKIKNHTFLLGVFPVNCLFFLMPKKIRRGLDRLDGKIADLMPHWLTNGWYFVLKKDNYNARHK